MALWNTKHGKIAAMSESEGYTRAVPWMIDKPWDKNGNELFLFDRFYIYTISLLQQLHTWWNQSDGRIRWGYWWQKKSEEWWKAYINWRASVNVCVCCCCFGRLYPSFWVCCVWEMHFVRYIVVVFWSKQAISTQVGLDNDVVYSRHDKFDLLGISCACEMRIHLLSRCWTCCVELSKSLHDVLTCIIIAVAYRWYNCRSVKLSTNMKWDPSFVPW